MRDENLLRDELVVPFLNSQQLMDLVGAIYKTSLTQKALEPVLELLVPFIEAILSPETVGYLLEWLDSPDYDKVMDDILHIVILAFNNLAPSKGIL
ncbi:MAG: hypothetical protein EF806_01500 [Candidatus Methanoliparum thermophilum]|uniref:Uncharacterized protein n=1 Tax=Methanoliparum thermophilum TaxID=2491083 RepID=A0A520KTE1_METT2|nr:hypothetical protein [Candidatus Methanoliparum sp. LAM-1]RZN65220.1 MAG: hypothetical protein EF806_01500 [Candidatus Methanoliparum thermophilum]BDC36595.1 hypothetical protein MTLP_12770 [Candidatus Methanoliparum sp. LAM-1]